VALREVYNNYVKAAPLFHPGIDLEKMPPLPGNYGNGLSPLKSYVYILDGDEYRNHRAVCSLLGIPRGTVMDFHEWIEANPGQVAIKEVVY
jgi:hypothetical protein